MDNPIRQLAQLHGIADSYLDFRGQPKEVAVASQTAILSALGIEAADDAAAEDAIHQYQTRRWTGFVPPAVVAAEGQPIAVSLAVPVDLAAKKVDWNVQLESGERIRGFELSYVTHGNLNRARDNAVLVTISLTGNHHRLDFLIGPRRALDPERWFVVCVNPLGSCKGSTGPRPLRGWSVRSTPARPWSGSAG